MSSCGGFKRKQSRQGVRKIRKRKTIEETSGEPKRKKQNFFSVFELGSENAQPSSNLK